MNDSLNIFRGRKVFITGHTGFKGAWLTFILHELGALVTGFSLEGEQGISHFNLLKLKEKIQHIKGDIRDFDQLNYVLTKAQPEFVFHLAAQSLVRCSYEDARLTFSTNVMGSVNLLEAANNCKSVRSLIYVTSDKCYENKEWVWGYRENDELGGHDPYSASKAAAEIIFASFSKSFFSGRENFGAASVRAGNVIGGGDWALDRIIPDCIRAAKSGNILEIRNPYATRPWQHVLEPLSGYLKLGAALYLNPNNFAGSWNFGPSSSQVRTVKEVAEKVFQVLDIKGLLEYNNSNTKEHEANLLQLNCDKASHLLGWRPRWDVDKALNMTAIWYKKYLEFDDIEKITRDQVREYFTGIKHD